ncbi:sodium:solute symporter family transporter [Rhodocaloribacter sp.]
MNAVDWSIMLIYMVGLIWMSYKLGQGQKSEKDYYLGGNRIHWFPVSISTMATQLSTNSLLGAPAFVAFSLGGGLIWLQYELAVPLAMIFIMIFLVPFFKKSGVISIYEYLEKRFGVGTRTLLSLLFQFIVAFGTGVTVYGISLVLQAVLDVPFWAAVVLLGVVTVVYDALGGIKSVIASDVIQMLILVFGVIITAYYATDLVGGVGAVLDHFDADRMRALDFSGNGLGDGAVFSFLPMLVGGFFLYVAYYGCNQTQVQRQLATESIDDTNMALFLNGLLRFPIVVGYCFMGVAVGAFATLHSGFVDRLPTREVVENGIVSHLPNFNMAVPAFVLENLPHGVIGIIIVALFAAAMSSLDSTINSLSAATARDVFDRFVYRNRERSERHYLFLSKGLTVFWGAVCIAFSFFVGNISDSIIVTVNQIGSLANGPILATFLLAILTRRATDVGTVIGIFSGFLVNLYLWVAAPGVSWLWWNVIGCGVTFAVGYLASLAFAPVPLERLKNLVWHRNIGRDYFRYKRDWKVYYGILTLYFVVMLGLLALI